VKCTRCLALNADEDRNCYHCGAELQSPVAATTSKRTPVPQRFAMIFMCIGYCVGTVVLPPDFPSKTNGINFGRAAYMGGFTAVFGTVGLAIGTMFAGSRRRSV
jgi:hypothetical protein